MDTIRKFRDYEKAYKEGYNTGNEVEKAIKMYKSHRRIFHEENLLKKSLFQNILKTGLAIAFAFLGGYVLMIE